jgi:hypothetical protein
MENAEKLHRVALDTIWDDVGISFNHKFPCAEDPAGPSHSACHATPPGFAAGLFSDRAPFGDYKIEQGNARQTGVADELEGAADADEYFHVLLCKYINS